MDQEQTPESQPVTDTGEPGSIDAAESAFEKRLTQEQQPTATEEDATDTEAEEADPEADEETPETAVLKYDGLELELPADQAAKLEKALLRQSDYSRKMNEVSAKEKTAQEKIEHAERLANGAEQFAQARAEIVMLDSRMKQFEAVNWAQLRQDNPAEYAAYAADLQSLRLSRQAAEAKAQTLGQEVDRSKFATLAKEREAMHQALEKNLKGWGDDMGTAITEYATKNGVSRQTLNQLTDPGVVIALEKARKYDELQASKATIKAKAQTAAPVLKPGAPRKTTPQSDAMAELRKHKSQDAAEAVFLSRMR